jgi:hypothetical protein
MKNGNLALWPCHLLRTAMPDHAAVNARLVELFERYRREHPAPGTTAGSYTSPDDLLLTTLKDEPAVGTLLRFIMAGVFEAAGSANGDYWTRMGARDFDVKLISAWFQVQNGYGFHDVHVHGNCSWSGVYYVQADGDNARSADPAIGGVNGVTRFYGPYLDQGGGAYFDYGNLYLQFHEWDSKPEPGVLCVFPSHLKHQAMPYRGAKDRIIVSFNAQVHGKGGEKLTLGYGFE